MRKLTKDQKENRRAAIVAASNSSVQVIAGSKHADLNATLYHANYVTPDWDYSKIELSAEIGNHLFYIEI